MAENGKIWSYKYGKLHPGCYTTPYARSLAHARGGLQDEEKIWLLPPFTPRPSTLVREIIILFEIYVFLYIFNMNY